jgi:hypothetical protein
MSVEKGQVECIEPGVSVERKKTLAMSAKVSGGMGRQYVAKENGVQR